MNKQKYDKWMRWLGNVNEPGPIMQDIVRTNRFRQIFAELKQMVDNNEKLQVASAYYQFTEVTYYQSLLMFIRRQVTVNAKSISLFMLAKDLSINAKMITMKNYANLYTKGKPIEEHQIWIELGKSNFETFFGGKTIDHLDPQIVEKDISDMEQVKNKCKDIIDHRLAHLDKKEPAKLPLLKDIEDGCDILNEIFRKYYSLLYATDYQTKITFQYDWKRIFRVSWI